MLYLFNCSTIVTTMKTLVSKILKGDKVIWFILLGLSLVSLLIVYSAIGSLAYRKRDGNTSYYLIKQMGFLSVGFFVVWFVTSYIPTKWLSMAAPLMTFASIVLLLIAFVMRTQFNSGRTLGIGPISFQPAELAKISLIALVSKIMAKGQTNDSPPSKRTFYWIISITVIVCGIITLVNFSTAALLFLTIFTLMIVGRIKWRYLLATVGCGVLLVVALYGLGAWASGKDNCAANFIEKTRITTITGRIRRHIYGDPNEKRGMTQANYAEMAIYNGGITGQGPGGSEMRNIMAAAYNDFIFAILVEEYGWASFLIIIAYFVLAVRGVAIVRKTKWAFPAFLAIGFTSLIVYQSFINIGVSTQILPVTGQTLPWISMGGSSTLFTAISFGFILRVSYQNELIANSEKNEKNGKIEESDNEEDSCFDTKKEDKEVLNKLQHI